MDPLDVMAFPFSVVPIEWSAAIRRRYSSPTSQKVGKKMKTNWPWRLEVGETETNRSQLVGWLAAWLAGWLLAGCLDGWLAVCLAGWLAGWPISFVPQNAN